MGRYNIRHEPMSLATVKDLYKGLSGPLIGSVAINGIVFATEEIFMGYFSGNDWHTHICSGALAGATQSIVASPTEFAKCRRQMQGLMESSKTATEHAPKLLYRIYKRHGISTVFRGFLPTLVRDTLSFGAYFGTYFFLKDAVGFSEYSFWSFLAGGLSGMTCWAVSYPSGVIKTMLQTDSLCKNDRKYFGSNQFSEVIKCYQINMLKRGNRKWMWKGLSPCLVRAFVVNAFTFGVTMGVIKIFEDRLRSQLIHKK